MDQLVSTEQAIFQGEVQGVGFRWTFSRLAREHGLRGWVRNLPDGSVEAVMQGERERIAVVMRRIMLVSDRIRVTGVEQRKLQLPPITGFNVR
ncbi:MAG: acylphosphatase [bacterium]|nr:acylphosphatase [bacterium]